MDLTVELEDSSNIIRVKNKYHVGTIITWIINYMFKRMLASILFRNHFTVTQKGLRKAIFFYKDHVLFYPSLPQDL